MARDDPHFEEIKVHSITNGKKPKVAIYVIDHMTSGPIARAAKVAQQLIARGADVTLMVRTELMDDPLLPEGIKKVPFEIDKIKKISRQNPQWQVAKLRPDIVVIDEYPFVGKERAYEWEALIDAAKFTNRKVKVYGMSCDIPLYDQKEEGPHIEKRAQRLDKILVTGDPKVVDFDDYLPDAAEGVRGKREYVGFMTSPIADKKSSDPKAPGNIVVYLGGANLEHFDNSFISLLANIPQMNEELRRAQWHIVLPSNGHMGSNMRIQSYLDRMPEEIRQNIHLEHAGAGAGFKEKLSHADMAITGGGQTAIESALVAGLPTVIVPSLFNEQFDRADRFAAAMPDRIAKLKIPAPEIKKAKVTRSAVMYQTYYAPDKRDWIDRVDDWAANNNKAADMRSEIERVYAARGDKQPNNEIMLDGARRIAAHIVPELVNTGAGPVAFTR